MKTPLMHLTRLGASPAAPAWVLRTMVLLFMGSHARGSAYTVTPLPAQSTQAQLNLTVADFTVVDASLWTSTVVGGASGTAVKVNTASQGGANIIWRGGIIQGVIPTTWDWTTTHSYGGAGVILYNNGPGQWEYLRVHNVEDAVKSREVPEYTNTGSWVVKDCYFTAIRDDSVEDDRFEPGVIQDSLFDGTYTFLSEQNENVGSSTPIAVLENHTTYIRRVYVRSYPTNHNPDGTANRFMGPWFKLQGRGVPNHNVVVEDSVFALGQYAADMSWSNYTIPPQVTFVGNNNFILWLNATGATYGGSKPAGVTFLEGAAARAKWVQVRNGWLTSHGLPAQDFEADYNPHTAPVQRIPLPQGGVLVAPARLRVLL